MQLSDQTLADETERRLAKENFVHSIYIRQFSPKDVVYASAQIYHRGNESDVREIRSCNQTSLSSALRELLRACDIANEAD
jgi:hypothetical protein